MSQTFVILVFGFDNRQLIVRVRVSYQFDNLRVRFFFCRIFSNNSSTFKENDRFIKFFFVNHLNIQLRLELRNRKYSKDFLRTVLLFKTILQSNRAK